jgi:hypothetical protein
MDTTIIAGAVIAYLVVLLAFVLRNNWLAAHS